MTTIIIIDKCCVLKTLTVKQYNVDELYKKCGFKKQEGFCQQVEWSISIDGKKYLIQMYGKTEGKSNMENKYDFPPPIDKQLYFGSCALVGFVKNELNVNTHINLSIDLWNKMYDKLFGGFEDLNNEAEVEDEDEDELENTRKHLKTKVGGYLKDGFVVESDESESYETESECGGDIYKHIKHINDNEDDVSLDDIGSELTEEEYL